MANGIYHCVNHVRQAGGKHDSALTTAMKTLFVPLASLLVLALPAPVQAELPPYLQCVPFARDLSGVEIYGDAHTWWDQAEGRYERGSTPREGAVLAFRSHGSMKLGHVATVTRVVDARTVRLTHANWSPIDGRRGRVERDVVAVDVSQRNDWTKVRVWYHPIQRLGKTAFPAHGFIYGDAPRPNIRMARGPTRAESSREFLDAFGDYLE